MTTSTNLATPRDVARILFRHARKMAFFFLGVVLLTLLAIILYPRSYSSESKLFIRVGRESVGLDPSATTGDTILLQKTQVDEINSALNILTGRAVMERAVERVGAERILNDTPHQSEMKPAATFGTAPIATVKSQIGNALSSLMATVGLSDPGTAEDMAIRRMEKQTDVWAPKDSTVITVKYVAASPELARDVVAAITDSFVDLHLELGQTDGSLEFFVHQVDELYKELATAETELRDMKNQFLLTSSGGRRSIVEQSQEGLREKIFELQGTETDLAARYTDAYPPLQEVRRQKKDAEALLAQMAGDRTTNAPSRVAPSGRGVKAVPAVAISEISEARSGRAASELRMLNDQELQMAQLERKVELLDSKYRMHAEKLEQARVNDALGRGRITNVKIAQPASLVTKPVAPKKPLILSLGLMLGLCGAIGLALFAETCDQTLRTTNQVEKELGIPVLLSLPYRKRRLPSANTHGITTSSNGNGKATKDFSPLGDYRSLVREIFGKSSNSTNGGHDAKTLGVVGCETARLRSRVASDIAIQAAGASNDPVLLIDADSRQRRVAKRFRINGSAGWNEVLAGVADAKTCLHQQEVNNLAVMPAGASNGQVATPKAGTEIASSLKDVKSTFGLVVVDLPSDGELGTAPADSAWLDEAVLVIEAERTRIQSAQHIKDALTRAGVHIKGVVLTNRREHIPRWLYQRL